MRLIPLLATGVAVVLVGLVGLSHAATLPPAHHGTPVATRGHALLGTWTVTEAGVLMAVPGMLAFLGDGVVLVSAPDGRAGLGSWTATSARTAEATIVLPGQIAGDPAGTHVAQVEITVDPGNDTFVGDYVQARVTATGTSVETSTGAIQGQRLTVHRGATVGTPSTADRPGDRMVATVATLEATITAQQREVAVLALQVDELEGHVALLLEALVEQRVLDDFLQQQLDDLRARVAVLEAAVATPVAASPVAGTPQIGTPAVGTPAS